MHFGVFHGARPSLLLGSKTNKMSLQSLKMENTPLGMFHFEKNNSPPFQGKNYMVRWFSNSANLAIFCVKIGKDLLCVGERLVF